MIKEESIQCVLVWAALRRRRGWGRYSDFVSAKRAGQGTDWHTSLLMGFDDRFCSAWRRRVAGWTDYSFVAHTSRTI